MAVKEILLKSVILLQLCLCIYCDIDYNTINEDGSFRFRHTNDDIGSFYHSASGTPDNTVRGRYGSRNPATGQVEETVYTAGPRGFRVNGPKAHRKMDLAQYPPRPIGSPDDPLADPFDDPSYSFSYRAADHSRSEDNDASGRVRGRYSYIDDEGERHNVRYEAGAGTGFEVTNAVPDNPVSVGYVGTLYKAPPDTRGKMTVQRGPEGSYKLIVAGPDHRRAESRDPTGLVRGTYSFLDDKGVQRTVEYIAGAGIGYRVVQNSIGPGTHNNPSVADFRLQDPNFKLANDFGTGASDDGLPGRAGSGSRVTGTTGNRGGSANRKTKNDNENEVTAEDAFLEEASDNDGSSKSDRMGIPARRVTNRGRRPVNKNRDDEEEGGSGPLDRDSTPNRGSVKNSAERTVAGNRIGGNAARRRPTADDNYGATRNRPPGRIGANSVSNRRGSGEKGGSGYIYDRPSSSSSATSSSSGESIQSSNNNNYIGNDDDIGISLPPLISSNRKVLEVDRERDWVEHNRDSTVIKNVGKWYIGLPPGQSVRAHVQNIDILPLGGRRVLSPSEALRQDEIADMVSSLETEKDSSYNS